MYSMGEVCLGTTKAHLMRAVGGPTSHASIPRRYTDWGEAEAASSHRHECCCSSCVRMYRYTLKCLIHVDGSYA